MSLEEGEEEGEAQVDFGPGSILGHSVLRVEDPALLTGAARFLDDLPAEGGLLHAVFVRSFVAHARLLGIATEEARGMPGVAYVLTGADLGLPPMHEVEDVPETFARPILCDGIMRFVGEPVAVVVADSRAHAVDAAESVLVEYDPLPAVVDPVRALEPDAPVLFPEHGSNAAIEYTVATDPGVLEDAEVVIRARFINQRLAPTPMETNGALAVPDPDTGGLTVWLPVQAPFASRKTVARILGLEESKVRVIAPKVGGGFGAKIPTYAEQVAVCALALRLGRPVRYVETRTESMSVMTHGRAQVQDVELGARRDGTITGLRVRITADAGAYPDEGATLPPLTGLMASGPYIDPADPLHRRRRRDQHDADRCLPGRRPTGGDGAPRARDRHARRGARDGPGRDPPAEPHPADRVPLRDADGGRLRHRRVRAGVWTRRSTSLATKICVRSSRPVANAATACSSASASASTSR